jgi:tetratricopeptide (TPR) repeat protein
MSLWLSVLLVLASPAVADEDEDTRERAMALYEEGGRLYDAGKYEEAVEAFRIAYSLSEKALLLYNMASALERLGRWDEAADALATYRDAAPETEREKLDSRIAELRQRIADREASVPEVEEVLPPEPVQAEAPQTASARGPSAGVIALYGTGAVGLGVGSVFTAKALGARSEWTSTCVAGTAGMLCPESAEQPWTRDNRSSVIADIGWVVGLGAIGGGVVLSLGGKKASDIRVLAAPNRVALGGRW